MQVRWKGPPLHQQNHPQCKKLILHLSHLRWYRRKGHVHLQLIIYNRCYTHIRRQPFVYLTR